MPNSYLLLNTFKDGKSYDLVMSDEFNRDGRRFVNGHDPTWTAIGFSLSDTYILGYFCFPAERSDDDQTASGRMSLQFYNASLITTEKGNLVISTTTEDTKWRGWYGPFLFAYAVL